MASFGVLACSHLPLPSSILFWYTLARAERRTTRSRSPGLLHRAFMGSDSLWGPRSSILLAVALGVGAREWYSIAAMLGWAITGQAPSGLSLAYAYQGCSGLALVSVTLVGAIALRTSGKQRPLLYALALLASFSWLLARSVGHAPGSPVLGLIREVIAPITHIGILVVLWTYSVLHRRVMGDKSALCDECGYNLTGNITGRCSECGTAFDLSRIRSNQE